MKSQKEYQMEARLKKVIAVLISQEILATF